MARTKQTARKSSGNKAPRKSKVDQLAHLASNKQSSEPDTLENCYLRIITVLFPHNKRNQMVIKI